jgi:hypothetical protein
MIFRTLAEATPAKAKGKAFTLEVRLSQAIADTNNFNNLHVQR